MTRQRVRVKSLRCSVDGCRAFDRDGNSLGEEFTWVPLETFERNMADWLTGCTCRRCWNVAEQGALYFEKKVVEGLYLHKNVLTSRSAGFISTSGETNLCCL